MLKNYSIYNPVYLPIYNIKKLYKKSYKNNKKTQILLINDNTHIHLFINLLMNQIIFMQMIAIY